MLQAITPKIDTEELKNDLSRHLEKFSEDSTAPSMCRLLLIASNQAISKKLYSGEYIDLGWYGSPLLREFDLKLLAKKEYGISRRHARIYFVENAVFVSDLGSTNGTYLENKKVEVSKPVKIENGDFLQLGRLETRVYFEIFNL